MNVSGGGLSYFVEKDLTALGFRLLLLGPPRGMSWICLRPCLISNASPGLRPSWAV